MFEPDLANEHALQFSRFDKAHPLSSVSSHAFTLADRQWQTAEHYYQACKFSADDNLSQYSEIIASSLSAESAYKLGNRWWKPKRPDFKQVRRTLMSRALYSKLQQNSDVKAYLLDSGDQKIIETSLYGYFWGVGRDQRGENTMGKIWMDIRAKLANDL